MLLPTAVYTVTGLFIASAQSLADAVRTRPSARYVDVLTRTFEFIEAALSGSPGAEDA